MLKSELKQDNSKLKKVVTEGKTFMREFDPWCRYSKKEAA